MALTDIFNFIDLADGTGLAGMPTREQCGDVAQAGFAAVINLAPENDARALADEAATWADLGLSYRNIPVPWTAPEASHLDEFSTAMDALAGEKVFVHCMANMRVTAFYALYAMSRQGWPRDRAQGLIDRIWAAVPGYTMDQTWHAFITAGMARVEAAR